MRMQNFISIGQLKLWEFPIYVDNLLLITVTVTVTLITQ